MTIEHVIRICFQYQNEIAIAREFYTNTVWRDKDTEKKKKGNRRKNNKKSKPIFVSIGPHTTPHSYCIKRHSARK